MERDKNFEQAVGAKVRELRLKLSWSQKELADHANLEQNQIQRIENARNTPSLAILTSIAKALGKQPFEILKVEYQVPISKNIDLGKRSRAVTTKYIRETVMSNFLRSPRSVMDIIKYCEDKFKVQIPSSATSAVLKKMVDERSLKRIPANIKGRYLYQLTTR